MEPVQLTLDEQIIASTYEDEDTTPPEEPTNEDSESTVSG